MKKIILSLFFLCCVCFVHAQDVTALLTAKSWVFDSVYSKESQKLNAKEQNFYKGLFRAAKYEFIKTGKYTFERPNVAQISGKWELEDQFQFLYLLSDNGRGKRYKILEINENNLIIEDLSSKTALTYKHEE